MPPDPEPTYSLGAVVRLTGLSAHVLRAWERRYGAVRPLPARGGAPRSRGGEARRPPRLRPAVAPGPPISDVPPLPAAELERRAQLAPAAPSPPLDAILYALDQLDAAEAERLLGL